MTGIYKITNNVNGKVYVGQAKNISSRWKDHINRIFYEDGEEYNSPIHRAVRKYNIENFSFSVLERCDPGELDERERFWIDRYQSNNHNFGYNLTSGGDGAQSCGLFLGVDSANEIKTLLSETDMTQWDIANKYFINQAVVSYINTGDLWYDENTIYPIRQRKTAKKFFCADCGKEVCRGSERCHECAVKHKRLSRKRPDAEQLTQELIDKNGSFSAVGRSYHTTGYVIRQWCDEYGMSKDQKDYRKLKEIKPQKIVYPVQQIDMITGEVVQTFGTPTIAKKETGITHIMDVCNGKRQSAGGFFWREVKD